MVGIWKKIFDIDWHDSQCVVTGVKNYEFPYTTKYGATELHYSNFAVKVLIDGVWAKGFDCGMQSPHSATPIWYCSDCQDCDEYLTGEQEDCKWTVIDTDGSVPSADEWPLSAEVEAPRQGSSYVQVTLATEVYYPKGCNATLLADGKCDEECSSEVCGLDLGDCGFCAGGCTRELFFNEECDEVCNVEECGFDNGKCVQCAPGCYTHTQVGDGHCDSECFEEKCDFDGKDCGYCAEDCPLQRLGDGHCDEACVSKLCGGDGGDCGTQLVGECLLQWVGDGVCQPQCWTHITSWDGGDCDCAPGCTQELQFNDICDPECANSKCDWDNHQCVTFIQGVCATGCKAELLADGVCENDCNTPECGFDSGDCLCAPKCEPQLSSTCNNACMNPSCEYGHFPSGCSSHFLVALALAHQTLHREFSTTFNRTQCTTSASTCNFESFETSFQLGQCEENCNTKECDFALGLCSEYVEDNCARGYSETPGSCFECKNNFLLFNGFCAEKCPNGFKEYIGLIKLCIEIEDFGHTLDHIYVLDKHEGDGSFDHPFGSLYIGLATAWHTNTVIELLGNEVQLKVAPTWNLYKTHENRLNPLKGSRTTNLTIKSLLCQDTAHPSCSSRPSTILISEPVSLTAAGLNITIENVFITSRTVFEQSTFNYCPALVLKDGMYWDDRNLKATMDRINAAALCQQFSNFSLIIVESGSNLWMKVSSRQNVTITNFTIQALALINIKGGNIVLESVNFNNVQPSMSAGRSAIILQSGDCEPLEECGSLLYRIGSVRFINDGYEFKETIQLRPFLSVDSMRSIEVAGINFEYCSVADFSETTALLFIRNFVTLNLTECSFENNLFIGNLLRVHSSEYFPLITDKQGHSELHELTHITLQSLLISRVYAQSGIVSIESSGDMLNIQIHNCSFVESSGGTQSILAITHSSIPTAAEAFGGILISKDFTSGVKQTLLVNQMWLRISSVSFVRNVGYSYLMEIVNTVNLLLSAVDLSESGVNIRVESIVRSYLSQVYARILPPQSANTHCSGGISVTGCINAAAESLSVYNNSCSAGSPGLLFQSTSGSLSVRDFLVSGNVGQSSTAVECAEGVDLTLRNLTVVRNRHTNFGAIDIRANASVSIFASKFQGNVGFSGAAVHSAGGKRIAIVDSEFIENTVDIGNGGALFVEPLVLAGTELAVTRCRFERNRAQFGGAVYISFLGNGIPLLLSIQSSNFTGNFAALSGASVHGSYSGLSSSSVVDSCLFANESSPGGSVALLHQSGTLRISHSAFINNTGSTASAISLQTNSGGLTLLIGLVFSSNAHAPAVYKPNHRITTSIATQHCRFEANNGAIEMENGNWTDDSSVFMRSEDSAVVLSGGTKAVLQHSVFEDNRSPVYAGAAFVSSGAELLCSNCSFRHNSAGNSGGAIFTERNGRVEVNYSSFIENSAEESGSAVFLLSAQWSSIHFCVFQRNSAKETAVISMVTSELTLDSSVLEDNKGQKTAGLSLMFSTVTVSNCSFASQESQESAFLSLVSASAATVVNSSFAAGRGTFAGGIYVKSSNLSLSDSSFLDIFGEFGGGITAESLSFVSLANVTMQKLASTRSGSLLAISNSALSIAHSHFHAYGQGGVNAQEMSITAVRDSVFTEGKGTLGSALCCIECSSVSIVNCTFSGHRTKQGVVYVTTASDTADGTLAIVNSTFLSNYGEMGTAVYAANRRLSVRGSTFEDNIADSFGSEGGALYVDCTHVALCSAAISDSVFIGNHAEKAGGAIAWKLVQPVLANTIMTNNSARYAPDVASFAVALRVDALANGTARSIDSVGAVISGLAPGQLAGVAIIAALVDHYGQVLTTDDFSSAELTSADPVLASVSGVTKVPATHGVFLFSEYMIYADPGTHASLLINASLLLGDTSEGQVLQTLSFPVNFELRKCAPGESIAPRSCIVCEYGTFGVDPTEPCQNCPQHAECLGSYSIVPDAGYWRSGNYSRQILKCPRPSACLGGHPDSRRPVSLVGYCSEGYEGILCQSCAQRFSRTGKNKCDLCPSLPVNVVRLAFTAFALTGLISVLVYTTMRSSTRPAAVHSIYLKILVNYMQLVMLVADFKLNWPQAVLQLFEIQEQVGVTEQLLSLDCFLSENQKAADIFYYKILYMAAMPVLMGLFVVCYWLSVALYRRKKKKLRKQLPATLVIVFFFMHPTFAKTLLSIFNCTEVDSGEYWLTYDMAIRCWDTQHYKYMVQVGIPGLAVWVLGVPLICLCVLVRCRKRLDELWLKLAFGFLINGYRRRRFYWEFVVIYRKITIICCSVFITTSIAIQALVVQLVMVIHFFIHWEISPYLHSMCNKLELRAIVVADVTIYCGLFYLTDDLTSTGSWIFFAVIVGINVLFLAVWANAIVNYFLVILARKIPLIGRIYSPEIVNRDEYIERFISMFGKDHTEKYAEFPYRHMSEVYINIGKLRKPTIGVPEVSMTMNTYSPRMPKVKNRSFDEATDPGTVRGHERTSNAPGILFFPPEHYDF